MPAKQRWRRSSVRSAKHKAGERPLSSGWIRFAQVYTPVVLGVAILIAVVPPLLYGSAWSDWLYRSLVLLVVGCPGALVISTPVSIVASLAAAAKNGILVKGGVHMEMPARLKAITLDKTGTITIGRPQVVEAVPMNGHTETDMGVSLLVIANALRLLTVGK